MKFVLILMLPALAFALETIICDNLSYGYRCQRYDGSSQVYTYPKSFESKDKNITFHEGDGYVVAEESSEGEVKASNDDSIGIAVYNSWTNAWTFTNTEEKEEKEE